MISKFAVALAVFSLAACSGSDAGSDGASETPTEDIATTETPLATETADLHEIQIPAAIRGRWGLVPADCTTTRGDAKGLLVIDAVTLKFYESVGTLDVVKEVRESRVLASFNFTGEGMNWTRDEELDLRNDGKELIRTEHGSDAMPEPLHYTRCP